MITFEELGLNSDLMKSLDDLGFREATPIQEKTIPFILKSSTSPAQLGGKKDLIALAQTGTGKTAAFGLPILNQLKTNKKDLQSIILCPTRELCIQITKDIKAFAKYSKGIDVTAVYGGERINIQIKALKNGTNIVVGTPGRVHDLIRRGNLHLGSIKWLVLDEADEMLDMGFKDDLDAILEQTPITRQTLLFSATISKSVHAIARQYMKNAEEISIGEKNTGAENVSHEYFVVAAKDRFEALKRILDSLPGVYGIIFCRTRIETQEIADKLKRAHYDTEALHGDISQNIRTKIMDRFKKKQVSLLVATDVAARGIDVSNLTHVINYNLPDQNEGYTHRSGRTGRAHQSGISISIITAREVRTIRQLENSIGKLFVHKKIPNGKEICMKQIDNFLQEIEQIDIKKIDHDKYFLEIEKRLSKIHKEDLIKYFITHKFSHLMDAYQHARDLNAEVKISRERNIRAGSGNDVNLKINFGRRHQFDIKALFRLINSSKKLKGIEIGRISLMPEYSIFSIDKKYASDIIKSLTGANFRGRKVRVVESNEEVGYRGKRRGRGNSSGSRRKRPRTRRGG